MKHAALISGMVAAITASIWSCSLHAQAGSLDMTFGGGGIVTTSVGNSGATSVAIQPDGKILVAGPSTNVLLASEFALVRYNTDGTLDTSFDMDGRATTDFGDGYAWATAVALQPDGKIVVAGYGNDGAITGFTLARFNAEGSMDTSFSGDGKVVTAMNATSSQASSVAIHSDGRIVAAGHINSANQNFAVVRYHSNGSLDSTFSEDGMVTTAVGVDNSLAYSVALQPDGKIVAAGFGHEGAVSGFAVVRYEPDGSLDASFSGNGIVVAAEGNHYSSAASVALQADGKIVAAGIVTDTGPHFCAMRFTADGSLDNSFGTDGKVATDIGTSYSAASSVALQPDGKIVVAGTAQGDLGYTDFAVLRYHADGSLDNSFNLDGKVTTPVSLSHDRASTVALQPDGRIVAAGSAITNGSNYKFAVVRYLNDLNVGLLDLSVPDNSVLVFPNPIHGEAILQYELAREERITIQLLDLEGRVLQTFLDGHVQPAGPHQQAIALPRDLASGAYLIVISSATGRMGIRVEN